MPANPHFKPGKRYKRPAPSRSGGPGRIAAMNAARLAKRAGLIAEPAKPTIVESAVNEMGHADDSPTQLMILKSAYGLPLAGDELALWRAATERAEYVEGAAIPEVCVIAGAQSGKDSRIAAPIAVYEAIHGGHERLIKQGEPVVIALVAPTERTARVAFDYIAAILERPAFKGEVARVLSGEILLKSGVSIETFPCTKAAVRGRMIPVAILDELAYFRQEGSANADEDIQTAVRRGQLLIPTARIIKISTPYMQSGVLYDDFKRFWGQGSRHCVVYRVSTQAMNPAMTPEALERMRATMSPEAFRRELMGEFAEAISTFLSAAWLDAAVQRGVRELPPAQGARHVAGVDMSGGGADASALSVARAEGRGADQVVTQVFARRWPKPRGERVDVEGVVAEIAQVLRRYGLSKVHGDRYTADVYPAMFRRHGVEYANPTARVSGEDKYLDRSMVYLDCEPMLAQGRVRVLDDEGLLRELRCLERRPSQGGRDRVDHPRGMHDDLANASCISFVMARGGGAPRPMAFAVEDSGPPGGSRGGYGGARGSSDHAAAQVRKALYGGFGRGGFQNPYDQY